MAKRLAAKQLTQETCEEEDEVVDPGVFQKASASQLKERVMKKAKRHFNADNNGEGPFAAFAGLTSKKSPFVFMSNGKEKLDPATRLVSSVLSNKLETISKAEITNKSETKTISPVAKNTVSTHSPEYFRQMKALNESFLSWIKEHMDKNSYADFTPVCKDYEKHSKTLDEKFKSGFTEPVSAVSTPKFPLQNTIKSELFSFGAKSTTPTFALGAANPNYLNFGTKPTSPFSFASKSAEAPTAESPNKEQPVNAEDENYVPPKNDFTPFEETDAIFSQKCKLFYKKDGNYAEKGVGTLYLKSLGEETQLIFRANTTISAILLNIRLNSAIPTQRIGKNNVLIVCVPNPSVTTVPTSFLIRVKTSEEADQVFEKIEEHKCLNKK